MGIMSEHTPGPLKVTTSCGGHQTVIACDKPGPEASHALGYTVCRPGRGLDTAEANARLWAASPDLLAACEDIAKFFRQVYASGRSLQYSDGRPVDTTYLNSGGNKAIAAVAKTKGADDDNA